MKKKKLFAALICLVLFAVLIAAVKKVDVASIGPENSKIGLSSINKAFHDMTGLNMTIYKISEIFGYLSLATAGVFALTGFIQLIKRKSLAQVDKEIFSLAGLYVIVMGLYVAFNKIVINYRPEILPDEEELEASFPSSHTMLGIVIMGSAIIVLKKYFENNALRKCVALLCCIILAGTVIGRLLSGAHWLTDIIGGILISVALLSIFSLALAKYNEV